MSSGAEVTAVDLIRALENAAVLEAFCRLPAADQQRFARWIGAARDDVAHWRRINAFVEAMRESPLQPTQSLSGRFERAAFG